MYAFVSPDAPDTVTIIANFIPLEAPAGGPNFYQFGDDVLYEINISNSGTQTDISYQFSFSTAAPDPAAGFLYNTSVMDPAEQWKVLTTAIILGGHVRVGMEDNPFVSAGQYARSNAELVEKIELPVYLAGGIDAAELTMLRELPLAGVIVGAAIANAPSSVEAAKKMRAILDGK